MRRVVIETTVQDLTKLGGTGLPDMVSSFEIVHFFTCDRSGCAGIGRMTMVEEDTPLENLVYDGGFSRIELLSRRGITHVVYFECKCTDFVARGEHWPRVFATTPTEFRDGRARITFIGAADEIKRLFKLLERLGVRTRVISLTDETLDPNSPMTSLTEKQRQILTSAYKMGYYDVP